jgi:hypothetical protein
MSAADDLGANGNTVRWKGIAIHGKEGGSAEMVVTGKAIFAILRNTRPLARKHISPIQISRIMEKAHKDILTRTQPKSTAA